MKYPIFIIVMIAITSCQSSKNNIVYKPQDVTDAKSYWYNGEAEISSYNLSQARYGEIHLGRAVLVFVTEPFSIPSNTKADKPSDDNVPVLKLNATKTFETGIYPYSIMTSTFFPYEDGKHSLKVSYSMQEWCGHSYIELVNNDSFKLNGSSYFEGESIQNKRLEKNQLEDDLWSMIRLAPQKLPVGTVNIIPSFSYCSLVHQNIKTYSCIAELKTLNEVNQYTLNYPSLDRQLAIKFEAKFPHRILSWEETYMSGWGKDRKKLSTTATLIETVKVDYWNKNKKADLHYRSILGL